MVEAYKNGGWGPFKNFNAGHALTLIAMFASTVFMYGALKENVKATNERVAENTVKLNSQSDRIEQMDRLGTIASRTRVDNEHSAIVGHESRLNDHDKVLREIPVMSERIGNLQKSFEELRAEIRNGKKTTP